MLRALAVVMALVCGSAYASEPSSPSATNAIANPQQQTTNASHRSAPKTQTPDTLPSIIKIIPAAPLQIEASEKEVQRHGYSSAQWWLVWVTGALVLITGTLAVFTFGLWRRARKDANRQAEEMRKSLAIARESTDAARQEFLSTHRPRIAIRELVLIPETEDGDAASVRFAVANCGESAAHIIESHFIFYEDSDPFPKPRACGDIKNNIGEQIIFPGNHIESFCSASFAQPVITHEVDTAHRTPHKSKPRLYFYGFVRYSDIGPHSVIRRISVYRSYDFTTGRFRIGDDPDHNYQD